MKLWKVITLVLALALVLAIPALAENLEDLPVPGTDVTKDPVQCQHVSTHEEVQAYPTCTDQGSAFVICDACGDVVGTKIIPAKGHNFTGEHSEIAATCTTPGSVTTKCANVGCTAEDTKVVPALGHDWNFVRQVVEPTCTVNGYSLRKCMRCDIEETYVRDPEDIAKGHAYVLVAHKDAKCEEAGFDKESCQKCGAQKETPIAPLGHKFTSWTIQQSPTCEEDGLRVRYCTRACCYDGNLKTAYKETQVLKAHGHSLDEAHTTVNADGSKTGVCVWCSKTVTIAAPVTPDDPTTAPSDDPTTDPTGGNPGSGSQGGTTTGGSSSGVEIPATGDSSIAWAYVMMAAAIIGLAAMKKSALQK